MSKIYKFNEYSKEELESLLSTYNSKDIILYSDVETNSTYIYIINSESYATISYPNDNNNNINSFYQNINNLYWEDNNSTPHSLNTENVGTINNVLSDIQLNHIDTTNFIERISKSDNANNINQHNSYWEI